MLAWFAGLPWPVQIVVAWLALCVVVGVVLGIAQVAGLLPPNWTPQRIRDWFSRRRDDGDDHDKA